ncbi:MAG: phosphatase PAP2 family protein [Minisyncoccia bacterium]
MLDAVIIFCGKYLIYIELLAFAGFVLALRARVRWRFLIMTVIALPLAYLLGKAASFIWYDPRPFVESGITPLIAHVADNGFPSDHLLLGGTLAALVMMRSPRVSIVFWLMAAAIGAARVLAHVHHTVDILAGAAIGLASAFIAFEVVVLYPRRRRL